MYQYLLFNLQCYIIILILLVATIGDYCVAHAKIQVNRAIFDNSTHAAIGGLCWFIVCINFKNRYPSQTLIEIVICTSIASLIDLDHFISARSLNLQDAVNLSNRPFFHCSTIPFSLSIIFGILGGYFNLKWFTKLCFITFVAFATHHTRDATRRGYWFYPFESTPPIPYMCYIMLTVAIPYFICFIMNHLVYKESKLVDTV